MAANKVILSSYQHRISVLKPFLIWFWLLFGLQIAEAQCNFSGSLSIPDEGTTGLNLLINNAAINDLGNPSQGVCQVLIKFKHDVIGDLNISLLSPSNQMVQLVGSGGTSSGFTDGTTWDIQFTPCASPASPDPGFSPFWSNDEFWQAFQQYSGTYYPYSGCLEDFNTGPVNGTWTLLIEDVAELDEGVIESFTILFCDDTSIDCSPCNPPSQNYALDSVEICRGVLFDDKNLSAIFSTPNADTVNYSYDHLVFNPAGFIGSTKDTLISSLDPGTYKICLLSFHQSDSIYVANLPKNFQDSTTAKVLLERGICGLVNDCLPLTILPVGDTIRINETLCQGDTLHFQEQVFTNEGVYLVSDTSGKCDTIYELKVELFDVKPEVSLSFPILDCNHNEISIRLLEIQDPQNAIISWTTNGGNIVSGANTDSVVVNAKGFYKFQIVNANCSWIDSVFVDADLDLPSVTLVPGLLNCDSINILIRVSSSSILSSVNWSGPMPFQQIGLDIRVTLPGLYVAEIIDQNGCSVVKTIEINQDVAKPRLQFDLFSISCTRAKGFIQVRDSFNIKSVLWSGPAPESPASLNSLFAVPGMYNLEIKGFNGCDTVLQVVIPDERYQVDVVLLPDTLTCSKKSVTLTVFSGRVVVDQQWIYPDMSSINVIDPVVALPGIYKVTVTDIAGCTGNTTVEIGIDTIAPVLIVTDRWIDCDSTQVKLKVDNASPGYTYEWIGPNFFSSKDSTPIVNREGKYDVVVTDENGCTGKAEINVFLSQDLPEVNFLIDTITCSQPIAELTPLDTAGIDFLWLSNDMLNPPSFYMGKVDSAGSYTVRVTNRVNGCKRDYFLSVIDNRMVPDFSIIADTLDCEKTEATLKVEGSIEIKSLLWTGEGFSSMDSMPKVNNAGWYAVTITDSMNCIFIDSVLVTTANDVPDVAISGSPLTCISNEAVLTANADPKVTFTWKLGDLQLGTGRSISVFNVGVYTVIGKGEGNCFDTATYEVFYDTIPPVLTPSTVLTLNCDRDSINLFISSGEFLASMLWEGPSVDVADTNAIWVNQPGSYQFTGIDTAGCVSRVNFDVLSEAIYITYDSIVKPIKCNEPGSVELVFSDPPAQLIWNASPIPLADGTSAFQTTTAGIYGFEATSLQGCITRGQVIVPADTIKPDVSDLTSGRLNCLDTFATIGFLSGLPNGTLVTWDFGSIVSDTIRVNQAGMYTGTITSANGCDQSFTADVVLDVTPPVFQTISDTIDCTQSKTDIEITGPNVYKTVSWLSELGDSYFGQKVKVDEPGFYFVTVEGENGCIAKDTVEVKSDFSTPQLMLADSFYLPCDGSGVAMAVSATTGLESFKWVGIDQAFFSTDPSPIIFIPTRIRVSASGANGCEAHDTTVVILSPLRPVFGIKGDTLGCVPGIASLFALDVADDKKFVWTNESGEQWITDTLEVTEPGTYRLLVTANNGCQDSLSFFVPLDTLAPTITISQSKPFICNQRQINIIANVQDAGLNYIFEWSTSDGNITGNGNTLSPEIDQPGNYQISVINSANGCEASQSYRIVELPNPIQVSVNAFSPLCMNDDSGVIEIAEIADAFLPINFAVNGNETNSFRVENLGAGDYLLEIKDSLGCLWDSLVTLAGGKDVHIFLPGDTLVAPGDEVTLGYTSVPIDQQWLNIEWQTLPGSSVVCSNCETYSFIPGEDVLLVILANDSLGCLATDTILIKVDDAVTLSFPNVFQPSSGGNNSSFYIPQQAGLELIEFLRIYDNWGNLVFSAENILPGRPEDGWNGQFNGCPLQPGVYVYQMQLRLKNGNLLLITKDLTLIR